jgi:hypothetical protein
MKVFVSKIALATSVALATLITAGAASAQPPRHADPQAYDAMSNPDYGFGRRVTVQPGDVLRGNWRIGRDPDPFIRDQLLREDNSSYPD